MTVLEMLLEQVKINAARQRPGLTTFGAGMRRYSAKFHANIISSLAVTAAGDFGRWSECRMFVSRRKNQE